MPEQPYTVEQVATLLGLHVKTIRGYVRDGRLRATRIGKQYRIARHDLDAFTGATTTPPATETTADHRHTDVSTTIQIHAISRPQTDRLTTWIMTSINNTHGLRVQTRYDTDRATLTIMILGDLPTTTDLLNGFRDITEDRP
ncbi:helix-turn-helix domain-containing protein [Nonomuraea africana]|uniref:Excisionase family DNA binding protein n=1 Tax=Nonomuraea africana TaxID=46171 RepID=A0ABR9KCY9_9ACTN|nr:helix-turn-helix domain-containing protein [Nonomuraea africana]MBE1559680.1 excisionase family DNA binding protein [Nonomuraea africana]